MARRVVQECDLTKQEYDPSETVTLVIKRGGKKSRTYELSSDAAAKIEQQLVSGKQLSNDWFFASVLPAVAREGGPRRTLGDLEHETPNEDDKETDAQFIAGKKREMTEEGVDLDSREKDDESESVIPDLRTSGDCLHMNKGRIEFHVRAGERHYFRKCRECQSRVPEKQKGERASYMNAKAPRGTRAEHDPRVKEREQ